MGLNVFFWGNMDLMGLKGSWDCFVVYFEAKTDFFFKEQQTQDINGMLYLDWDIVTPNDM